MAEPTQSVKKTDVSLPNLESEPLLPQWLLQDNVLKMLQLELEHNEFSQGSTIAKLANLYGNSRLPTW